MTDVRDETEHVAPPEQRSTSADGGAPVCEAVHGKHSRGGSCRTLY
jgi:hypothetical protein